MSETPAPPDERATPAPRKRDYHAPELSALGSFADLTRATAPHDAAFDTGGSDINIYAS
ncbi:MAG TPA: lasso RiPP family leader peptide-containing protein [Thermoleophilaceae bacterium]|nr:lasso RiPP family leader peptide-containing protein [Thermoleophilaceae bacterium]